MDDTKIELMVRRSCILKDIQRLRKKAEGQRKLAEETSRRARDTDAEADQLVKELAEHDKALVNKEVR